MVPEIIAIDGPAAAGKGTLAKRLADHFGLALLDTGSLYRAVGLKIVRAGGSLDDPLTAAEAARRLCPDDLENPDLKSDEAAAAASKVAVIPPVRAALLEFQRNFAQNPPPDKAGKARKGAVLDGRDIGTVVCPAAPVKLFITASPEVRAARRLKELQERGGEAIYARVLSDMKERDARDSGRETSPLKPATDACHIDTSDLDADQVFQAALDHIRSLLPAD
jgi:cytidylate kinase